MMDPEPRVIARGAVGGEVLCKEAQGPGESIRPIVVASTQDALNQWEERGMADLALFGELAWKIPGRTNESWDRPPSNAALGQT
jgi:hypothetical protein